MLHVGAARQLANRQPQRGDLIVSRQPPPYDGFGLSQWPGAVQIRVPNRQAATELARRFGECHGVDVWEQHGTNLSLVASCRRST